MTRRSDALIAELSPLSYTIQSRGKDLVKNDVADANDDHMFLDPKVTIPDAGMDNLRQRRNKNQPYNICCLFNIELIRPVHIPQTELNRPTMRNLRVNVAGSIRKIQFLMPICTFKIWRRDT